MTSIHVHRKKINCRQVNKMTRLTSILLPVMSLGFAWLSVVTGVLPLNLPTVWWYIVTPLPFYALVIFGCYALASVGYSVYCIKSDDNAAALLMKDIEDAKAGLKDKGFEF